MVVSVLSKFPAGLNSLILVLLVLSTHLNLNSDDPTAIQRPPPFVSNGPSVAAVSAVIGEDTFLRAHHEFLWSKTRPRFHVEWLGNAFQFGASNCVIGYRRHLPIRVTLVQKHGRGAEPGG